MDRSKSETVLLVCEDEARARPILAQLFEHGLDVIGPVSTARLALALAAQNAPTLALIAQPPTGRRNAEALAAELFSTWGVRSAILSEAAGPASEAAPWAPTRSQMDRLGEAAVGLGRLAISA